MIMGIVFYCVQCCVPENCCLLYVYYLFVSCLFSCLTRGRKCCLHCERGKLICLSNLNVIRQKDCCRTFSQIGFHVLNFQVVELFRAGGFCDLGFSLCGGVIFEEVSVVCQVSSSCEVREFTLCMLILSFLTGVMYINDFVCLDW